MIEPKVSIIVPVHNVENFLRDCLDSIIGQTLKDIEIICVDDGSTDNSKNILLEYRDKDKRITVLSQACLGAGAARNYGIKIAKGKYIAFLDSDDFFDKEMLEKCYENLNKNESDIVIFSAKQFDNRSKKTIEMPWSLRIKNCPSLCFKPVEMNKKLFNSFQNWPWNKLFRRSFIIENDLWFQEIPRTNDMAFVCEALVLANRISIIDKSFVYYRVNTGTSLQQTNDNSPLAFWDACIETKKRLQKNGLYNIYQQTLINSVVGGALYNFKSVKTWKAYKEIFYVLKYEIEKEFNISSLEMGCFYDINSYNELNEIMKLDLDEYLYIKMKWWKNMKNQTKQHRGIIKIVNGCIKCYRQYGFKYTLKRVLFHLGLLGDDNSIIKKPMVKKDYDFYAKLSPEEYEKELKFWYKSKTGKELNLDNPKTFNEKIQWMKLYDSTPLKTELTDKYLVRAWIKEKIGEEYLLPLYGVWDNFDEIDFDTLPNQFALKANHGSGWNIIVKDKSKLDIKDAKKKMDLWMSKNYAYVWGLELHYKNIKPKIIAEQYVENIDSLDDYKFMCSDGKVNFIFVITDRNKGHYRTLYTTEWKRMNQKLLFETAPYDVPKPKTFDKMMEFAQLLSKGFAHVRVDFYEVDGKLYFGEMTFTSDSGLETAEPEDFLLEMGNMIKLPSKSTIP